MHKRPEIRWVIAVCFWLCLIVVCLVHRDELTVERIVGFVPGNILLAVLVMLALFALKGSIMLVNGNILYMTCGVLFSLPLAIGVNLLGSVIMTTIPFMIGCRGGAPMLEKLRQKYKRLSLLCDAPKENEFSFTLFLRIIGILPCEPVGMYLGACWLRYTKFICGTLLGLLPAIVSYTVMGEYAADPTSPYFLAAAAFRIATTVCTLIIGSAWTRKKKEKFRTEENKE